MRVKVSNLANASALIYSSLLAFPEFGSGDSAVNWCGKLLKSVHYLRLLIESGFYIDSPFFPSPRLSHSPGSNGNPDPARLLLGPFCGKPACQFIHTAPGKARGVCSDAYIQQKSILVPDVGAYPGHIGCDGNTKSEIVCPLFIEKDAGRIGVGVLDLDCLALGGFSEEDRRGLEKIALLISKACDW